MILLEPSFKDSPYLIVDEKGWRLKKGAPKELERAFKEYMDNIKTTKSK